MGRVAAAMANIAYEAGWNVTLVGVAVDPGFDWATHIRVPYNPRLPAVAAGIAWVAAAGRRLRRENLSDAVVHVHAPLLMRFADIFTCHHLAEGAARHGLRELAGSFTGVLRRTQEVVNVRLDSLEYRMRPRQTRITFVSEFLRDEFTELYGEPNGGDVLPPPAPPWHPISPDERAAARRRYGIDGDQVTVGYFGGNDPRKGVERVVEMARETRYAVLGAGPKSEGVQFGARKGLGYVTVRDVLAACDVVVAPTVFDAAPVAVLEAVAAGSPVVTGVNSGWAKPLMRVRCRHGLGSRQAAGGERRLGRSWLDYRSEGVYRALFLRVAQCAAHGIVGVGEHRLGGRALATRGRAAEPPRANLAQAQPLVSRSADPAGPTEGG
jgi:glycosyltransferase involved in cell wall biosynthesis